ncbi:hypothetical protein [Halopelagius fulvigenes]|uniref:Calcium-binding protein n=1 Tax=Halopelagius fulvigenes TaxID=1198324 RepID=A0ABD5TWF8_9EURY
MAHNGLASPSRRTALKYLLGTTAILAFPATTATAQTAKSKFKDEDRNGFPDEGEVVTGNYKALYAYDANGD